MELTPEERAESVAILKKAIVIANKHGQAVLDDAENHPATSATAAAIMMSTFCAAAEMSMHDAVGLLMSVHKQTQLMMKERQQ